MKLGFWGVGLPVWEATDLALLASRLGYHGVDLQVGARDTGRPASGRATIELEAPDVVVAATRQAFADTGVQIASLLCYNASPVSGAGRAWQEFEREMARHAGLASRLGVPAIRFMLNGPPDLMRWEVYLELALACLGRALDQVPGVTARIQNHAGRAGMEQILAAVEAVDDPRIGIELSPDHMLVMQEDAVELVGRAAHRIHKVCLADRVPVAHDLGRFDGRHYQVRYRSAWLGEGAVPVAAILEALADIGYDGYCSLKWEPGSATGSTRTAIDALADFPAFLSRFASTRGLPSLA